MGNARENFNFALTPQERKASRVLVVDHDSIARSEVKGALRLLEYGIVSEASDFAAALKRLAERPFSHLIFRSHAIDMLPQEFLETALRNEPEIIALAASEDPQVEDVFNLLKNGAKGYLVLPCNPALLDQAIAQATKGEPISLAVLNARDRNEAFAGMITAHLDRTARVLKEAASHQTAAQEVPELIAGLRRAAQMARMFAEGGEEKLLESLEAFCLNRANQRASRLGRLREKLKEARSR